MINFYLIIFLIICSLELSKQEEITISAGDNYTVSFESIKRLDYKTHSLDGINYSVYKLSGKSLELIDGCNYTKECNGVMRHFDDDEISFIVVNENDTNSGTFHITTIGLKHPILFGFLMYILGIVLLGVFLVYIITIYVCIYLRSDRKQKHPLKAFEDALL